MQEIDTVVDARLFRVGDESRRELDLLQKVTDRWTAEVDRVGKHKETEIMEVG